MYQNRITASEKSPIHLFQARITTESTATPHTNDSRISTAVAQPQDSRITTRSRRSTCFRLGSHPKHSHIAAGITAEPQPHQNRITASEKSLIHLFQARTTPEPKPHHTRSIAKQPIHLLQARTAAESQPHCSRFTAEDSHMQHSRTTPYHSRITAMTGTRQSNHSL